MKMTIDQLKGLGYVETKPGHWHKGNELLVSPHPEDRSVVTLAKPAKRIRQSSKPLLNKLEQEWFDYLKVADCKLYAQSVTFKLANGLRYTPDVFCFNFYTGGPKAWEVKGQWFTDDANAKLKMFASIYTDITVFLVWKEQGQWKEQIVLP